MVNLSIQILCVPVLVFAWVMTYRANWLYDIRCRRLISDPKYSGSGWNRDYWRFFVWDADKLLGKPEEK